MPLCYLETEVSQTGYAVWYIDEPIEILKRQLHTSCTDLPDYRYIRHPKKQLEWLASRLLIQHLAEQLGASFKGIYKDAFGKPHLRDLPYHISIAHCFPYAVGAVHKSRPVGIDIEKPDDKLLNIRNRFLNQQEAHFVGSDLEKLCRFWTAKEVLYKLYGRRKLIFREHMEIFQNPDSPDKLGGRIRYQELNQLYDIMSHCYGGHYITYNV